MLMVGEGCACAEDFWPMPNTRDDELTVPITKQGLDKMGRYLISHVRKASGVSNLNLSVVQA